MHRVCVFACKVLKSTANHQQLHVPKCILHINTISSHKNVAAAVMRAFFIIIAEPWIIKNLRFHQLLIVIKRRSVKIYFSALLYILVADILSAELLRDSQAPN